MLLWAHHFRDTVVDVCSGLCSGISLSLGEHFVRSVDKGASVFLSKIFSGLRDNHGAVKEWVPGDSRC
jgi:hypothetical protein